MANKYCDMIDMIDQQQRDDEYTARLNETLMMLGMQLQGSVEIHDDGFTITLRGENEKD